jgi:hypothetical protein
LIFVKVEERGIKFQYSAYGYPVFSESFTEQVILSPNYVFDVFIETQLDIVAWVNIWYICSVP